MTTPAGAARPVARQAIWALTIPLLFSEISDAVIDVTDTAFVARVGITELASLAFANTLLDMWTMPAIGVAGALQIVLARRLGQGRREEVGPTFSRGMIVLAAFGVGLAAALKGAGVWLGATLGGSQQVATGINEFVQIAAYGLVFYVLTLGCFALYIGIARTKIFIAATIVLSATNLVLSYALTLGRFGAPALGLRGAAIAFTISEAAAFLVVWGGLAWHRVGPPFGGYRPGAAADSLPAAHLARLASPIALQSLLNGGGWLVFFVIMQRVSQEAVAWSNVVFACYAVLVIPAIAFAETTDATVSNAIGAGRGDEVRQLISRSVRAGYAVTVPALLVVVAVPDAVLSLFSDDPAAMVGAAGALRIVAAAMLVAVPAEIWLAAVAGTGATDVAFGIEVAATAALLAFTYVAAVVMGAGLPLIWTAVAVAAGCGFTLSYAWVRLGPASRRAV